MGFKSLMLALPLVLLQVEAQGAVIFSSTQTGAQLAANVDVTFPTVAPNVDGTSLEFGTGAPSDVLMRWALLPANARSDLHFEITIYYEELTSDNDPRFGISDGPNFQGGSRTDQGLFVSLWSDLSTTTASNETWESWCESLGAHIPANPIQWEMDIATGGVGPTSVTNYQEDLSFCAGPQALLGNFVDVDQPLSFVLYRDTLSGSEQYRLDSVSIVISDDSIPPPTTPLMNTWGVAALAALLMASAAKLVRRSKPLG